MTEPPRITIWHPAGPEGRYPLHLGARQALREQLMQAAITEAVARANRMNRSVKCGSADDQYVGRKHASEPGGCKNDGAGCLCQCHDDPKAVR